MKILQINSVCGIGSTGRICTDLLEILFSNNHEGKICYGREYLPEKYEKISRKISNTLDIYMNVLQNRIFDNAGYGTKIYTKRLIKWIEKYNPDIIHLHNIHGYYINVEILFEYIKEKKIKVVWTFHDCWPFTGHCTYFDKIKCEKWQSKCQECDYTKSYPQCWFESDVRKNFDRKKKTFLNVNNMIIVTPSKWLAGLVKKSFLKNYDVRVVHNEIDTKIFKKVDSSFKKDNNIVDKIMILGVASGWSERKGLSDFIKLSNMLDNRYKIVLVGVENSDIKASTSNMILINKTNNVKELVEIYSAADVFLNLTYEDNYPTVNLESQACGTPVITYNTGGSIESVPKENIVKQGDIKNIINKIENINELGIISKKEMLDKYELFQEYLKIYKELCER